MSNKFLKNNRTSNMFFTEYILRFLRATLYSYKALFAWLEPKIYILTKIVSPLFQIIFFTYLGSYYIKGSGNLYYIIGNAVQISAISAINGVAMTVASERTEGTLALILGTPANRVRIFVSRSALHIIDGLITTGIGFLFGYVFLNLSFNNVNIFLVLCCIFITIFSMSGLGLLIGSFGLALREVNLLSNLIYYILLVCCGVNFPVTSLPSLIQKFAYILPLTHGLEAIRKVMIGYDFQQIKILLVEEFFIGTIYLILGYIFFRILELNSKHAGSIDLY
ncbi:ABC transporter permease [Geosporobacter ferrireducens]|uniref:Transport permease protein n=1 Tax=Geosporobacter ferrireducens TaxID=1424294 RepID=A0A1D8GI82_9FIRM|nr:ABC transporter permease [Geosporobacter ferrireducens]AOT70572.1 hypothetical protein Gferi_13915 [Geosporobacter ferrireducens]